MKKEGNASIPRRKNQRVRHDTLVRRRILSLIFHQQRISRTRLAQLTAFRPASITAAAAGLLAAELLRESGKLPRPGGASGRRQTLLELNPAGRFTLAAALDYQSVTLLALDLAGRTISRGRTTFKPGTGHREVLALIDAELESFIARTGLDRRRLAGFAFVDPGLVDAEKGVSLASYFIPGWREVPVREHFERNGFSPVMLTGTAQASAWAEYRVGAGRGCDHLMFIEYGGGISCGAISGGHIVRGCQERAGELGHCRLPGETAPCRCGGSGCLEALASLEALAAAGGTSGRRILAAAAGGDRSSRQLVGARLGLLAAATANAINLFNPRRIVLDRNLAAGGPWLLEKLKREIRRGTLWGGASLEFRISPLGAEAPALGGALLALEEYLERYDPDCEQLSPDAALASD